MNTCGRCGLEIRLGWREASPLARPDRIPFWMHEDIADDADHRPIFGKPADEAYWASIEQGRNTPWTTTIVKDKQEIEVTLTAAQWEAAKHGKDADGEELEPEPTPDPEITSTHIEMLDPRLPGGAKQIWKLAEKWGWRVARSDYSRGPVMHAVQGTLLGMRDSVVLGLVLDGTPKRAVASWESGKFLFAYTLTADLERRKYANHGKTNSDGLKAWIKGETVDD